jgi:hypothetical protein
MSYVNLNNPANFQLQEFEQLGFRYIVSGRPTISGETYRTIFVLTDAVVTATCPNGDSLSSETLVAGTVIHGFFEDVSVASGSLLAYKAGPITAQEIFDAYKAYVYAQGGIVEGESCAVADIAALLEDKLYSAASLVLIPSGYKVSHLYAERPLDSNGDLTFTRASNATRVAPDGLIEKVRTNLALYSEQFDNAAWNSANINGTGLSPIVTANAGTAPDGTTTADRIVFNLNGGTTTSDISRKRQIVSFPATGEGTISFYLKSFDGVSSYVIALEDSNGLANSVTVTGAWTRITKTASTYSVASIGMGLGLRGGQAIANSDVADLLVWGCQIETGVATPYIGPTTSAAVSVGPVANLPRLDYLNSSCPRLLLEPQRTNLFNFSEQFDNAGWTKQGLTITANSAVSPDGYTNADLLDDGTSASTQHWFFQGTTLANSTTYTLSLYAKYVSRQNMIINIFNGASSQYVVYNIQNGTIVGSTGDVTASITSVGSGWYRLTYTRAMAASGSPNHRIGLADDTGSETYTGSNKQTLIYGCQIEAGAYATSYVNTLNSAVTRGADACIKTGISSLIGQTEGTIFVEVNDFSYNPQAVLFKITGLISVQTRTTNQIRIEGTGYDYFYTPTQKHLKIAAAYTASTIVIYVNGVQVHEDTSVTISGGSNLIFNETGNGTEILNQALLFKTRLTNAQLAELTTL